jgi:ATP-dependent 26S proteasome regulatory subunit
LPDAPARERLLDLYARHLDLQIGHRAKLISEMSGTTPAFIRELVRRAMLIATERGQRSITDAILRDALNETRDDTDQVARSVQGAGQHG